MQISRFSNKHESVMKSRFVAAVVFLCSFGGAAFSGPNTEISYAASDLGVGKWQYTYTVENLTGSQIPEIEEFTIWFGYDLFDNLAVTTTETPGGWGQIVWQREPGTLVLLALGELVLLSTRSK